MNRHKTNIVKEQLIKRAKVALEDKKLQIGCKMIQFENPIGNINSISLLPNTNGCITPVLWESLTSTQIIEIYRALVKNNFYFVKYHNGVNKKFRLRRNNNVNT